MSNIIILIMLDHNYFYDAGGYFGFDVLIDVD